MITAARLLYAKKWKDSEISKVEEWMANMTELAQIVKLLVLLEKIQPHLLVTGNPL